MSDHMRKQIRDYVAAQLTGLLTTADRVYVGRARPLAAEHDPALLIYMRQETSRRAARGVPPVLERSCTLHIEGRVSSARAPDDLLDQIALEVEVRMAELVDFDKAIALDGLALNVVMTSTEMLAEADGERHIGGVRLEYVVTYRTREGEPRAAV